MQEVILPHPLHQAYLAFMNNHEYYSYLVTLRRDSFLALLSRCDVIHSIGTIGSGRQQA